MVKNNKMPAIRFSGYTEAWEQRKFSDIFAEVKSGLSRMLSNDDIGLPVVRANNINDGQLNLADDIKYWYKNDPQGANTNNYLIDQGDILINFINSEAKMGTAAYVTRRPERDTIYTTNILRCKVNDEYNSYFIYSLTFLNSYKNYIASITKPAVNQASFTTVDFKKYSIKIPTEKEQNQIANLIETFNQLITLHQRKLEKLKLTKKALLQKLFPQNGSKIPELRFKGFTDAWKQCKLGDLAEIVRGASPRPISDPKWFDNNSNVGWLRIADVTAQDGRIRYLEQKISELGQEKTRVIKTPHLLLSIAATVGKPVINYVPTGVHDGFLIFLNPKFNILFTFWWLEMFREKWNKYGQPGSQVNLNSDLVKNQVINIPNEKEQEKISSFLEALDKIITFHHCKLELLKNIKKGLLQKMFV